jgi:hypothetical protein
MTLKHFGKDWGSYHRKIKSLDHHAQHLAAHMVEVNKHRALIIKFDREHGNGPVNIMERKMHVQNFMFHDDWALKHQRFLCNLVDKAGNYRFRLS